MTSPCGCGGDQVGECFCSLASSDTITVSGSGTAASPYVMSLAQQPTTVTEADTDTVDMHVTQPQPGTYQVSADVNLSADAGNVLVQGTDGGLYVANGVAGPPPALVHMYQATSQQIVGEQPTPIVFDTGAGATPGAIIRVPEAGIYVVSGFIDVVEDDVASDDLLLYLGLGNIPTSRITGLGRRHFTDIVDFPFDDEVSLVVINLSGRTLNTATIWRDTRLTMTKVAETTSTGGP